MGRLVEGDAAVVALGEDAVEDDDMEVEVGIEGGAEAVQEGDSTELGVTGHGRAGAAQRGADTAEQVAQHVAGQGRVVGQEGPDPLWGGCAFLCVNGPIKRVSVPRNRWTDDSGRRSSPGRAGSRSEVC